MIACLERALENLPGADLRGISGVAPRNDLTCLSVRGLVLAEIEGFDAAAERLAAALVARGLEVVAYRAFDVRLVEPPVLHGRGVHYDMSTAVLTIDADADPVDVQPFGGKGQFMLSWPSPEGVSMSAIPFVAEIDDRRMTDGGQ